MTVINEIQVALRNLAEDLWGVSPNEDGYAVLAAPKGLRSELKNFEGRMIDGFDDEWGFPWGLESYNIISMAWDAAGPGLGSMWKVDALCLPSGRRIFIQEDNWKDQPQIISVSDVHWVHRIDRKFLQRLFKGNGTSFGTGVFGSPPNSVGSCVNSFSFLVDLFVAGFDAAGEECWEALLGNWDVWNEEYENPEDPIVAPEELLRNAKDEDIRKHGQPRNLIRGLSHQQRVQEIAYKMMIRDEINEFLNKNQLRKRSPRDPDAKVQIVARYLSLALNDPGR
jgi:hypothetical protein